MKSKFEMKQNSESMSLPTPSGPSGLPKDCYSEFPELSKPSYLEYARAATDKILDRLHGMIEHENHRFRAIQNKIDRNQWRYEEIQSSIEYEKQNLSFLIKTKPNDKISLQTVQNRINRHIKRQRRLGIPHVKEQALQQMICSYLEYVQLEASRQALVKRKEEIEAKLDQIKKERRKKSDNGTQGKAGEQPIEWSPFGLSGDFRGEDSIGVGSGL